MPKGGITNYPEQTTSTEWWEMLGSHFVMPGGALLNPTGIPLTNIDGRDQLYVKSGTLLGRTYAERASNIGYGLADVVNDDQIALLVHDVTDGNKNDEIELYRPKAGLIVYENFLPNLLVGDTPLAGTPELDKIRELYNCMIGSSRGSLLMSQP